MFSAAMLPYREEGSVHPQWFPSSPVQDYNKGLQVMWCLNQVCRRFILGARMAERADFWAWDAAMVAVTLTVSS